MSTKDDVGLFLVEHFPQAGEVRPKLVCRVIEATAYTAQAPAAYRMLAYKVGYWFESPELDEEATVFVCPKTEIDTFCFKISNDLRLTAEDVTSLCINHFLTLVLPGRPLRAVKPAIEQLLSINKAPWTYNSIDRKRGGAVYDVQHHEHFRCFKGEQLRRLYATLSYSPMLTKVEGVPAWGVVDWNSIKRPEFAYEYVDQTLMVDAAGEHLLKEEIVADILTHIRAQIGA